jgi:putative redox protein
MPIPAIPVYFRTLVIKPVSMASIKATIGMEHYATHVQNVNGIELTADEPLEIGGKGLGLSPGELLASALASCTCITMRMYADRKEWPMTSVDINVDTIYNKKNELTDITRHIQIHGELAEEQRARLVEIADKCPMHKLLSNPVNIKTILL